MARKSFERSALREWAGVVAALIAVVAFVNVGYTLILIEVFTGLKVDPPEAWSSGMISLSSAALGFLIGKQSTANSEPAFVPPPVAIPTPMPYPLPPTAPECNVPDCPSKGLTP